MATNDIWRLSLMGSHSGTEIAIITLHFRMKTNVGTFAGLAAGVKATLIDNMYMAQATGFRWDKINGLKISPLPKQAAEYTTGLPQAGGTAGDEMPHQIACVVSIRTAYAGRSYRGRNYFPGLTEASGDNGLWNSTLVNSLTTHYTTLVTTYGEGGSNPDYEWIVWSERLNTGTPVNGVIVRAIPGVIRRRRVGVGQ